MSVRRTNGGSSTTPSSSGNICENHSGKLANHRVSSSGTTSSNHTSQRVTQGLKSCLKKSSGEGQSSQPKQVRFNEYCTITTVDDIDAYVEEKVRASKSPAAKMRRCLTRIKNVLSSCFSPLMSCFRRNSDKRAKATEEISVKIQVPSDKSDSVSYSRALVTLLKQWINTRFNKIHPLEANVPTNELRELLSSFEFLAKQVSDPELKKTFQQKADNARKRLQEQENVENVRGRISSLKVKISGLFSKKTEQAESSGVSSENLTVEEKIQQGFERNIDEILQTKIEKGMRAKLLFDESGDQLQEISEELSGVSEEEIDDNDESDSAWSKEDLVKMLFLLKFTLEQWGKQILEGALAAKEWLSRCCNRCKKSVREDKAGLSESDVQFLQNLELFFSNKQQEGGFDSVLPRARALLQSIDNWDMNVLYVVGNGGEEPWYQVPRSVARTLDSNSSDDGEYVMMRACLKEGDYIVLDPTTEPIYVSLDALEAIYEDMGPRPSPPQSPSDFRVVFSCPSWLRSVINIFATGEYYDKKTSEIEQEKSKPCVKRVLNKVLAATGLLSAVVETDNQGGGQENSNNHSNASSSRKKKK